MQNKETFREKKERLTHEIAVQKGEFLYCKPRYCRYRKLEHIHGMKKWNKRLSQAKIKIAELQKEIKKMGKRF